MIINISSACSSHNLLYGFILVFPSFDPAGVLHDSVPACKHEMTDHLSASSLLLFKTVAYLVSDELTLKN